MATALAVGAIVLLLLLAWPLWTWGRYYKFKHNALFHPKYYRFNWRVFWPRLDKYIGWIHHQPDKEDVHG